MKIKINKNKGFSLVELMIAVTLGLIVLTAVTSVLVSATTTNSANLKKIRLSQDLRAVMAMITRDIRRIGGSMNATADMGLNQDSNPFDGIQIFDQSTSTVVYDDEASPSVDTGAAGDCILFSYDVENGLNGGGVSGTLDADEQFGFRFDNNEKTVEVRQNGAACNAGGWANLTDERSTSITALNFLMNNTVITLGGTSLGTSDATITMREITITLTGETNIGNGQTTSETLQQTIRIRNDDFDPAT